MGRVPRPVVKCKADENRPLNVRATTHDRIAPSGALNGNNLEDENRHQYGVHNFTRKSTCVGRRFGRDTV